MPASDYERPFEPFTTEISGRVLRLLEVKPGSGVIDVAAGTGAFSLAAAASGIHALATDISPGMLGS